MNDHTTHGARNRLLALMLRPTPRPIGVGIAVAAVFITVETLLVYLLRQFAPENAFGALFLFGVLVVSAGWGFGLGVATSLASAVIYVYFHLEEQAGTFIEMRLADAMAVIVFIPVALLANVLAAQARLRAVESELRRREADRLAGQQAALRRVATRVARGAAPADVYPVAVTELARGLGIDHVTLLRFDTAGALVVLAHRDPDEERRLTEGERLQLDGTSLAATIARTGAPARMSSYADADGPIATRVRELGINAAVGAPILVGDMVWGALIVGTAGPDPMPADTEARVGDFADLVATAISNAVTRAELTASRARIVAAGDQARRRFERDLHDGAQQRVVSLGIFLRAIEEAVPAAYPQLREQISDVVDGLTAVSKELQEISRGIHPAILSNGGLGPALKALARRSAVPVDLDIAVDRRLPEPVEVAAYYVVAEAMTNAAKHADASLLSVRATIADDELDISVGDDGVGGAVAGGGSGLIGLKDRVAALSGRLDIVSPAGAGTTLVATFPLTCP
jgi:signal transduction histidine kinase